MGLDMFAHKVKKSKLAIKEIVELAYWRKENALHGWMERLYKEKGGTDEFNCIPLELSIDDLFRLLDDTKKRNYEGVPGFFFGDTKYNAERWRELEDSVFNFVFKSVKAISEGYIIEYSCWY